MSTTSIASIAHRTVNTNIDIQKELIKENSITLKAIACIPIVGWFCAVIQERRLERKLTIFSKLNVKLPQITIKNILNDYKIANIIRNAFNVAFAALSLFAGMSSLWIKLGMAMGLGLIAWNAFEIHQNNLSVQRMRSHFEIKISSLKA